MLASAMTPVSTEAFVFQLIQVPFVNAAIWNMKAPIAKEVNYQFNQKWFCKIL